MKKKLLSVVLALAMVLSLMPMAWAEETAESTGNWIDNADTSWYEGDGPYIIDSAEELAGLAKLVNDGTATFKGKTIELGANIDLSGKEWTPIGIGNPDITLGKPFSGTFNGCGKTISNLSIHTPNKSYIGLFGYTTDGEVKNFTLHNAKVTGDLEVGAIAGTPYTSKYTDISVTGLIQVNGRSYVGGALGKSAYKDVVNVDVLGDAGSYVRAVSGIYRTYVGGLIGYMGEEKHTVADCNVEIDVTGSTCDVGGILGILHYGNTMKNCTYEGSLTLTDPDKDDGAQFGALTGTVMNAGSGATIEGCTAKVNKAVSGKQDVTSSITPHGDFYYRSDANNTGNVSISATVNGVPVTVTNDVAQVEGTGYKTVAAAVVAANDGETVTLLRDTAISSQLDINKNLTLDLGGKVLTNSGTGYAIVVDADKAFTLTNGTLKSDNGSGVSGAGRTNITIEKTATINAKVDALVGTRGEVLEGHATFNVHGELNSGRAGVFIQGPRNTVNIDGANITSNHFGVYQNGSFGGSKFTIKNSTIVDTKYDGIYISNSKVNADNENQGKHTLVIENSSITGPTAIEAKFTDVTILGENTEITATASPVDLTLNNNGSVTTGYALAITHNGTDTSKDAAAGTIKVENGKFSGAVGIQLPSDGEQTAATMTIKNGHFTIAPDADYLAEGKTLAKSSEDGYNWTVADKADTAAEVLPAAPEAEAKLPVDVSQEDKALADSALAALTSKDAGATAPAMDANVMNAEASAIANANTTTPENGLAELKKQGVVTGDSVTADGVTIVVQPYLDIKITGADADGSAKTLTLDITPMYQKVATTADLEKDEPITVKKEGVNDPNAVVLASGKLTVSEPVTVTIPLPDSFTATDDAKIGHKGYVYTGKIDNQHVLTFVNPHGFSAFTIGVEVAAVNETTGEEYTDFQTALDEAKNGETVIIKTAPAADKTFTMSGDSRTITVKNETGDKLTVTINGEKHENVADKASFTVKYTRPSSGGSSSSSYTVNVEDSKNGTVTASHKSASKNTTVTLTVKADKGYELDELTVTDKNGKELKLTDKGNGKYTFAMPASKVDVKATFAEIVEKPAYSDVSASAWYAKAVAYVTEKGMMEGDSGKFMPLDKLTRSQMAQVLFNLEGKKSVNYALTFGDMNGTEWYAEAVRWAASEQIVNGYDNGNFGPNDPITREQLVTVLYRYAQYKGLDTATTEENLTSFADAAQVSGYAVSAMNWAVGAGVINGTDSGLAPKATATRAEVAQILMNFDQKF